MGWVPAELPLKNPRTPFLAHVRPIDSIISPYTVKANLMCVLHSINMMDRCLDEATRIDGACYKEEDQELNCPKQTMLQVCPGKQHALTLLDTSATHEVGNEAAL